jgi:hypothetical protein
MGGGNVFACALVHDGAVSCWGSNDQGQLGTGDYFSRNSPAAVVGLEAGGRCRGPCAQTDPNVVIVIAHRRRSY